MHDHAVCQAAARAPCSRSHGPPSGYVAAGGERRAGARRHAGVRGAVPALWISQNPDLPGATRIPDECAAHISAVASGGAAGAASSAAPSSGQRSTAAGAGEPRQRGVGLRLVFDTCADGRTLKCLTVVDEFTRECLAIDVAGGIRSGRVIEVLAQLVSVHGAPRYLRSDNGPEFVATAILRWLQAAHIETAFIDPGKPWQLERWFRDVDGLRQVA